MPLLVLSPPEIRTDDPWILVEDDAPLPPRGAVVVPPARLHEVRDRPLGVRLEPTDDPRPLAPWLGRLGLVVLDFAFPHDGRPYSQARILREQLGWRGELRGAGALALDLAPQLHLAGFDSMLLPAIEWDAPAVLARILLPVTYTPRAAATSVWRARHGEVGG